MPDSCGDLLKLLDAYGEYQYKCGKPAASIRVHQNPCQKLIDFLTEKKMPRLDAITQDLLKEFQLFLYNDRDFRESTAKIFMVYLSQFFDFLIARGELKENPARGIEVLPKPEVPPKQLSHFYTYDEIMRRYLGDQERWVSYAYLHQVEKHIKGFFRYLRANEIGSIYPVTESVVIRYRDYLWNEFVEAGKEALVVTSQVDRLRCVVRLFKYLTKEGILKENATKNLGWETYYKELIEKSKTLPERPKQENNLTEFDKLREKFLQYELGKGKSPKTVKMYKKGLQIFFDYITERGIENVAQITKRLLLEYFTYVCNYVGVMGKPVSSGYKFHILWPMKIFFRYLVRFDYLAKDPSVDVEDIKVEQGLPHPSMSKEEVFKIIDKPQPNNHDPLVLRDKALMELLFATGIRSTEASFLNIEDIDQNEELVRINHPKGGKNYQRVVPTGKTSLDYLQLYLKEARPVLANGDPKALFLSCHGHRLKSGGVNYIVKKYAHECGFKKNITPHSFRSTCATLMLKNHADMRHVQEQLGHKRITSTQQYIRLIPTDLKGVHKRCHPREKGGRQITPKVSLASSQLQFQNG